MGKEASHSVVINAPADICYEAICDFESYPEWQKVIREVNVWSHYDDGRPKVVEYIIGVFFKTVRYVIDYTYNDQEPSLHWTYVEGDIVDVTGHYFFDVIDNDVTKATYQLNLVFGMFIPQKVMDTLSLQIMRGSVIALRDRVYSLVKARP